VKQFLNAPTHIASRPTANRVAPSPGRTRAGADPLADGEDPGGKALPYFPRTYSRAPRPPIAPSNRAAPPVGERAGTPTPVSVCPSARSSAGGPIPSAGFCALLAALGRTHGPILLRSTLGRTGSELSNPAEEPPNRPTLGLKTARGNGAVGASRLPLPPSKSPPAPRSNGGTVAFSGALRGNHGPYGPSPRKNATFPRIRRARVG
jgi:hypothetical protein